MPTGRNGTPSRVFRGPHEDELDRERHAHPLRGGRPTPLAVQRSRSNRLRTKRWGELTLGDDVYLVGVLDKDGNPECNDDDHVAECHLFPVAHEIPSELRAALGKRFEKSGWAKVPA